jgi:hypothetical protein
MTTPELRARGLSLIEVVLALALLSAVLVSIGSAFVVGARRLDAGGKSTEALSVARGILEEMDAWGFRRLWAEFGKDGRATGYRIDSRTAPAAAAWQARLDSMLPAARAEVVLTSLAAAGSAPPPLRSTRALRIAVRVSWRDGLRRREVALCTVRF